jgi:hypothetical protein
MLKISERLAEDGNAGGLIAYHPATPSSPIEDIPSRQAPMKLPSFTSS